MLVFKDGVGVKSLVITAVIALFLGSSIALALPVLDVSHPIKAIAETNNIFTVTVLDEVGNKIEGASVRVQTSHTVPVVLDEGFTDVDGVCPLEVYPTAEGRLTVIVDAAGFEHYECQVTAQIGDADIIVRDLNHDDGRLPSWDRDHNMRYESGKDYRSLYSPDLRHVRFQPG